jgi:hypothetical protein
VRRRTDGDDDDGEQTLVAAGMIVSWLAVVARTVWRSVKPTVGNPLPVRT